MKVLVSGGTGYVGRFIVEELSAAGHEVVAGARHPPAAGFLPERVGFVQLLLDPDADQRRAFKGMDAFVHAAFDHLPGRYRGGEGDDPDGFRARNVDGSAALFRQAVEAGVGRLVFLSSRAVYGTQPPGAALAEDTRPHPDTLYGEVKLAAERQIRAIAQASGAVGTSLRVTGVYGPAGPGREDKWTPVIRDWLAGRPVEPRAGSEVHGKDVAAAVALVLEADRRSVEGQVFNVSDLLVERADMLAIVQQATGATTPLPQPAGSSRINLMETERIERLGWRPGGAKRLRETVLNLLAKTRP